MDFKREELERRLHVDNQAVYRNRNEVEYDRYGELKTYINNENVEMKVNSSIQGNVNSDMAKAIENWKQDANDYKQTYEELLNNTNLEGMQDRAQVERYFEGQKGRSKSDRLAKLRDMNTAARTLVGLNNTVSELANKRNELTIQEKIKLYLTKVDIAEQERVYQYKSIKLFGNKSAFEDEKLAQNDYECRLKQHWLLQRISDMALEYVTEQGMTERQKKAFMSDIRKKEDKYGQSSVRKAEEAYTKAKKNALKAQYGRRYHRDGRIDPAPNAGRPVDEIREVEVANPGQDVMDKVFAAPDLTVKDIAHLSDEQLRKMKNYVENYETTMSNPRYKNAVLSYDIRDDVIAAKIELYKKVIDYYENQRGSIFRKSQKFIKEAIDKVKTKRGGWEFSIENRLKNLASLKMPISEEELETRKISLRQMVNDAQTLRNAYVDKITEADRLNYTFYDNREEKRVEELDNCLSMANAHLSVLENYQIVKRENNDLKEARDFIAEVHATDFSRITKDFQELDMDKLIKKYNKWYNAYHSMFLLGGDEKAIFENTKNSLDFMDFLTKHYQEGVVLKDKMKYVGSLMENVVKSRICLNKLPNVEPEDGEEESIIYGYKLNLAKENLKIAESRNDEEGIKKAKIDIVRFGTRNYTKDSELTYEVKQKLLTGYEIYEKSAFKPNEQIADFYKNYFYTELLKNPNCNRLKNHHDDTMKIMQRTELIALFHPIKILNDGRLSEDEETKVNHKKNLQIIKDWCDENMEALDKTYHEACNRIFQYQVGDSSSEYTKDEVIERKKIYNLLGYYDNLRDNDPIFVEWLKQNGVSADVNRIINYRSRQEDGDGAKLSVQFSRFGLSNNGDISTASDMDYLDLESEKKAFLNVGQYDQNEINELKHQVMRESFVKNLKPSVRYYILDLLDETKTEKGKTRDFLDLVKEINKQLEEQNKPGLSNADEYYAGLEREREGWDEEDRDNPELIELQRFNYERLSKKRWPEINPRSGKVLAKYGLRMNSEDVNRVISRPLLKPVIKHNGEYVSEQYRENDAYNERIYDILENGSEEEMRKLSKEILDICMNFPKLTMDNMEKREIMTNRFIREAEGLILCYSNIMNTRTIPMIRIAFEELERDNPKAFKEMDDNLTLLGLYSGGLWSAYGFKKHWDINNGYIKDLRLSERKIREMYKDVSNAVKTGIDPVYPFYEKLIDKKVPEQMAKTAYTLARDNADFNNLISDEEKAELRTKYPNLGNEDFGRLIIGPIFKEHTGITIEENEKITKENRNTIERIKKGDINENRLIGQQIVKNLKEIELPKLSKEQLERGELPEALMRKWRFLATAFSDLAADGQRAEKKIPGLSDAINDLRQNNPAEYERIRKNAKIIGDLASYQKAIFTMNGIRMAYNDYVPMSEDELEDYRNNTINDTINVILRDQA